MSRISVALVLAGCGGPKPIAGDFSSPELFTGHLGGYIFARRVYLWRFVTLGTVEEDLSYRPAMCSLLTMLVKMIR